MERFCLREVSIDIKEDILDYMNDELYKHLSIDCWQGLRRVVGIVDIAIVGNKLIIPAVRGISELQDINRYIDFNRLIFKTFNAIND